MNRINQIKNARFWAAIVIVVALLGFALSNCFGQSYITNGSSVLTVSNGNVVATTPLIAPAVPPTPLVGTNGVVVPSAMIQLMSNETGVPISVFNAIPPKYLLLLAFLYFGRAQIARDLRKIIPDRLQVNQFGVVLANVAGEINPSIEKLALAAAKPSAPIPTVTLISTTIPAVNPPPTAALPKAS